MTTVYWRRQLPPLDAEAVDERTLEADSTHVSGEFLHRDDRLWESCQHDLARAAGVRLDQEVHRLGGRCARVLDEHIEPKFDDAHGEAWLHGRYTYMLYR
jgi:hypothetical protein